MTATIIIAVCLLLLVAYVFDITASVTKIPSVILLLLLGWGLKEIARLSAFTLPDLTTLLPILGTIGLILIVLEGALELELNKSKLQVIKKSFLTALLPMFAMGFMLAGVFSSYSDIPYQIALINAIPFCVISSAIAIPSVKNLRAQNKEFVIYESSLSDILGVLFFNFVTLNHVISITSFLNFGMQLIIIILISFISIAGLSYLLTRIKHHITYTPIILLTILIYEISKVYHLPALIFILVFGLFLNNFVEFNRFKWFEKFRPEKLDKEVIKFRDITIEATFLVRALFFILFGFMIEIHDVANLTTLPWAVGIVAGIMLIRWLTLRLSGLPTAPLIFIAPRGLITILLFLSILPGQTMPLVNNALIIQTIILSVLIMMVGLIRHKQLKENTAETELVLISGTGFTGTNLSPEEETSTTGINPEGA